MSDEEFINFSLSVFKRMQVHDKSDKTLYDDLRKLKIFMIQNADRICVQNFKRLILDFYINLFNDSQLILALNINDVLKYEKQIKVYQNLPFTKCNLYGDYLARIIEIPSNVYGKFYREFFWVLETYFPVLANSAYFQALRQFVLENDRIIHSGRDDYYDLATEIYYYNQALYGYDFRELELFNAMRYPKIYEEGRNDFVNKRLGNIGEILVYQQICEYYPESIFVAKDLGNGFGYDIFYNDGKKQNLVEVKTTRQMRFDDFLILSESEYATMLACKHDNYAEYMVYRVKLDSNLKPGVTYLKMIDEETLCGTENSQYKRILTPNNKLVFKREI